MRFNIDDYTLLVFTLIHAPRQDFVETIVRDLRLDPSTKESTWIVSGSPLDLASIYFPRPPGDAEPLAAVFWSPASMPDATVFYPNSSDGWQTLIRSQIVDGHKSKNISIRTSRDDVDWPIQEVEVRQIGETKGRYLRAMDDDRGRMEYLQRGQPLANENLPDPEHPFKGGRKELITFVKEAGVSIDDPDFWRSNSDALYLKQIRPDRPKVKQGPVRIIYLSAEDIKNGKKIAL